MNDDSRLDCSDMDAATDDQLRRDIARLTRELEQAREAAIEFSAREEQALVVATKLVRRLEQAQAACAAMQPLLSKLYFHMKNWGSQEDGVPEEMYADWKAAFETVAHPNPGQPLLNRMAGMEKGNADLCAVIEAMARGNLSVCFVDEEQQSYYLYKWDGKRTPGEMVWLGDIAADAALAGLAELRKETTDG